VSRVLVTRAAPDAQATAARLAEAGHEAVLSPVLVIEAVAAMIDPGAQALVFTSAAGPRCAAIDARLRAVPVFAVGEGTAAAARAAGFEHVRAADGGGAELVALAAASLDPAGAPVIHVSGADVVGDVAAGLRAAGFAATRVIVYRAAPASALTPEARARLAARPPALDFVLFHSARGGESFARLAAAAGVAKGLAAVTAACLSPRVAEMVKSLAWREILVASAPREGALLSLLGPIAGERT
jgi:uroporphyrinogen-III synthase